MKTVIATVKGNFRVIIHVGTEMPTEYFDTDQEFNSAMRHYRKSGYNVQMKPAPFTK